MSVTSTGGCTSDAVNMCTLGIGLYLQLLCAMISFSQDLGIGELTNARNRALFNRRTSGKKSTNLYLCSSSQCMTVKGLLLPGLCPIRCWYRAKTDDFLVKKERDHHILATNFLWLIVLFDFLVLKPIPKIFAGNPALAMGKNPLQNRISQRPERLGSHTNSPAS